MNFNIPADVPQEKLSTYINNLKEAAMTAGRTGALCKGAQEEMEQEEIFTKDR